MKRIVFLVLAGTFAAGCTTLQDPSKRVFLPPTDFSHPNANTAYYEFSSSPLDAPSVLEEDNALGSEVAFTESAEDEDFTAENVTAAYGTYGDVVTTVATHKFKLGPLAGKTEMTAFQKSLDNAYTVALKQYRPVGFTYAMSSVGAVNPISDIEVACKLSERSANQVGQSTCTLFFNVITRQYKQLMQGNAK